jgi:NAD(P)-dependent dehydrogenase (short-subunit alcohol dehydrogenase family)
MDFLDHMTIFPDFKEKIVLVTGGASGIGRATSVLFASMGAFVVILDRNQEQGSEAVAEIQKNGGQASLAIADVSNASSCEHAVMKTVRSFGKIETLVNCAGMTRRANVIDTTEEDWDQVIGVNLKSVFLMAKYVVPVMKENGGGSIVNVSSGWGITGGSRAVAYCASKGGVVLLTKAMAVDHGPDNIRINCVCPGDTHTPMLYDEAEQLGLAKDALVVSGCERPLGRVGKPEEIAAAIVYLASNSASFITGASLIVDGGGLAGSL